MFCRGVSAVHFVSKSSALIVEEGEKSSHLPVSFCIFGESDDDKLERLDSMAT